MWPLRGFPGGRAESGEGAKMRTACGNTLGRTVTLLSPRRTPAMDPSSPCKASQTQPAASSLLTSYRWHTGGDGEKVAGGSRWGRLAGWGRALSHQEPVVNSQPASRSLFRRVLSAPPKESRTSRLRLSKTLWGRHKSPPLEPEPEPEAPGTWLPHPGWEGGRMLGFCLPPEHQLYRHRKFWFPAELGTVFSGWREACKARGSEALGPRLVCASLFLRLLCPAILAPSLFGLAPEHPAPGPARALTLIAKVIQNLANSAPFGEKEAYMGFMNSFLEDHGPAMQQFLDQVAMVDVDAAPSGYQGSSDLALQLAVLHAQLCTIFAELDQATRDSLEPLPTILRAIEEGRPVPVTVPMRLPPPPAQVHASRGRPWTGASASLPRKPSVPWQRQLDQPRDRDQALGTHRPVGKLAELQCEVASLREEQKALSRLVESLGTDIRGLMERQEQLQGQLQDLDSRLRQRTSQLDPESGRPSGEDHRLRSLERRLAEMESTQVQLRNVVQSLQLLSRTPGSRSQSLPLKPPCINGDTT
ncbi:RAS protein activator like-3 [Puma concolor]|uniref:RAS protein activator like-3 n=1 Tax=Puma concolor TaxID=9696 RepID=A0A6P6H891_PUMCO|nr:RAS protein activator like-3 [Puma concolor]